MTGIEVATGELVDSGKVICNQAGSSACADDCPHGKPHTADILIDCTREVECFYLDFIDNASMCHCEPVKKRYVQHKKSGCIFIASGEDEGRAVTGAIIGDKLINAEMVPLACLEDYDCELCGARPIWTIDGSIGEFQAVNICSGCLRKMADYLDELTTGV